MTASTSTAKPHGLRLWWWILILGCLISVVLNIWHAVTLETHGKGHPVLGIIFALVPVLFAALLSHGLVSPVVAQWFKWPILALFAIAMLTSISSQAAVLAPYGGGYGGEWSIPIVLDASTLLALNAITTAATKAREALEEADREAELAGIRADIRPALEADIRAEYEADMPRVRADIEAGIRAELEADMSARVEAARADIEARAEADMTVRLETAEADIRQRVEVEIEARLRREMAEASKSQPHRKALPPGSKKTNGNGLSSKDRAKILLGQNPEMTGGELGKALGLDPRSGRRLLDQIQSEQGGSTPGGGGHDDPKGADGADMSASHVRLRAVPRPPEDADMSAPSNADMSAPSNADMSA
ncbi:hypothetical protein [Nonomuraea guangzhouensis]|uniref:DUF2637 domain-containing protein n=1 Tax=Nonomuraea guangzhouensis TaxID=1291555 RepID=A0ABW4GZA7_9ACTN|nr:hypothetical protein [Nonomuraea guangzhouensis]